MSTPFPSLVKVLSFRRMLRILGVSCVGQRGEDKQGGNETGEHAGGYCYGNLPLAVSLTRQKSNQANVEGATALSAAQSQLCHGPGTPGLLPDNLASGAVLLWQQSQGEWSGVFCPSSPLFHPLLVCRQAAPTYRPVRFEALSCRAGPARNKPVS